MPIAFPPIARAALAERRLYKLRSLADQTQCERARDIVLGHRLWFSRLSELNDPLEGKPVYVLGDWNSAQYRQHFAEWAWRSQQQLASPPPCEAFVSWFLAQPRETHEQYVATISEENQVAIDAKWRVLSLSATVTNAKMWSLYADDDRGISLVFDASAGDLALAYQVEYLPECRSLDISSTDLPGVLVATLFSKLTSWQHEQEFRCIAPDPWEAGALHLDGQFLRFPPAQLLGIVFGSRMTPQNKLLVHGWATEREAPLAFWQATTAINGSVAVTRCAP